MNKDNLESLRKKIKEINSFHRSISIMEVCGTHTYSIGRFGIRSALNENINLISGPGCPVCVTPDIYLDYIYNLSHKKDIIITTYGDMVRVPGSKPGFILEKARAEGEVVKMVYRSNFMVSGTFVKKLPPKPAPKSVPTAGQTAAATTKVPQPTQAVSKSEQPAAVKKRRRSCLTCRIIQPLCHKSAVVLYLSKNMDGPYL